MKSEIPISRDLIDYSSGEFYEKIKPNYQAFEENLPAYWDLTYRDRWRTIRYEMDKIEHPKLLDIGCGTGRALTRFQSFGLDVLGVEPYKKVKPRPLLKKAILIGLYEEVPFPKNTFDVIYIEQVLSHSEHYKRMLKKAFSEMKVGGFLILEEPNDDSYLQHEIVCQKLSKENYWKCKDHVNYGGHFFWQRAVLAAGFRIYSIQGTWPMEWFELSGDTYLGDEEKGRKVHEKRYKILSAMTFDQRTALAECFASVGIGRDVLIYARK